MSAIVMADDGWPATWKVTWAKTSVPAKRGPEAFARGAGTGLAASQFRSCSSLVTSSQFDVVCSRASTPDGSSSSSSTLDRGMVAGTPRRRYFRTLTALVAHVDSMNAPPFSADIPVCGWQSGRIVYRHLAGVYYRGGKFALADAYRLNRDLCGQLAANSSRS